MRLAQLKFTFGISTLALALLSGIPSISEAKARKGFSESAALGIRRYWADTVTYVVGAPANASKVGYWQVRLNPEASKWIWNYERNVGRGKVAPATNITVTAEMKTRWDAWVEGKIKFDRANCAQVAQSRNQEIQGLAQPVPEFAQDPGPIPADLAQIMPNPPEFAEVVTPQRHLIIFPDCKHEFEDNPNMRAKFAYYRFREGVMDGGQAMRNMPSNEIQKLLVSAGISESERKVFTAVSILEGGFDSVNTYDTGFVSVGFIQFACLSGGAGSLGQVLLSQKQNDPTAYENDFKSRGIDVTPKGELIALNLDTGESTFGSNAAAQIIQDKRLIAVFQRAGRVSVPNRLAQLRVAKALYYPADDQVLVTVDGKLYTAKVKEFIKSEAGMATLMDRKVNTGTFGNLTTVLTNVIRKYKLNTLAEASAYEAEVVRGVKWRKDYLSDTTLSQPTEKPNNSSEVRPPFRDRSSR